MAPLVEMYQTDHRALVAWLGKTYGLAAADSQFLNPHKMRREAMSRRLRLYRGKAVKDVEKVIDDVYETEEYRATLKKYVPVALEQNVTKRINDEIASLYDRPALRIVDNAEAFKLEEQRLKLHFIMQEAHRLTNLCNEVLLWQFKSVDAKTKLKIVTPDCFDAIPHPADQLVPAAYLIDYPPASVLEGPDRAKLPHYEVWDDTYRYLINKEGFLVDAKGTMVNEPEKHGLGRIPGVLFHRREPTVAILDEAHGADIESAHLGIALINVMIMRLSKSQGERQPILQGNLAAMASGQVMNGERPLLLPPEVVASMLESKTDPDHYLAVKKDKLSSVANTHGMSYEQFTFQETSDSASGKAYQVRREKLTELRQEQRGRGVDHETQVVELIGFVLVRIDYQEQALPQDAMEEIELLDKKMRLGLDSVVAYVMRKDPDLNREQAIAFIMENLADFAKLMIAVRALNIPGDADAANPGQSPQENGGNNTSAPKGANPTPGQRRQPPREREATAA